MASKKRTLDHPSSSSETAKVLRSQASSVAPLWARPHSIYLKTQAIFIPIPYLPNILKHLKVMCSVLDLGGKNYLEQSLTQLVTCRLHIRNLGFTIFEKNSVAFKTSNVSQYIVNLTSKIKILIYF